MRKNVVSSNIQYFKPNKKPLERVAFALGGLPGLEPQIEVS
jgi:hypothetical protein